ncbi:MAG TPA: hypothetical protein VIG45_00105 [Erysipelothrix sp.]
MKEKINSLLLSLVFVVLMFAIYYFGYHAKLNTQLLKEMVLPLALLGFISSVMHMKLFSYGVYASGLIAMLYDAFITQSFLDPNKQGQGMTKIMLVGVFIAFSLELFFTLVLPFTRKKREQ